MRMHCRMFIRSLMMASVCLMLTTLVQAQYRTSIQGVVTDSTGAVIPGAQLTLTNPATGEKQVRVSDASGVFNFNALAAAPFRLEAESKGFQKKVLDNLVLIPDQANALNVELEAGAESTVVNVDAGSIPALETQTATINGVVSSNQVQHMPSFGRDVLKLAQLAPGAFGDGSQASGSDNYNLPGTQTGGGASGGNDGIFKTENGVLKQIQKKDIDDIKLRATAFQLTASAPLAPCGVELLSSPPPQIPSRA